MSAGTQIVWKHVASSESVEEEIQRLALKLSERCDRITGNRVVIEAPSSHHRQGAAYHVRLSVAIPGDDVHISREDQTDLMVGVHEVFAIAERKLREEMDKRRERELRNH